MSAMDLGNLDFIHPEVKAEMDEDQMGKKRRGSRSLELEQVVARHGMEGAG